MLCQRSYAVRSVRVCDIWELICLVPSMSMYSCNHNSLCVGVTYLDEYDVCEITLISMELDRSVLKDHMLETTSDLIA